MHLQITYNMYEDDLVLNTLEGLIGHKTKPNQPNLDLRDDDESGIDFRLNRLPGAKLWIDFGYPNREKFEILHTLLSCL